MCVGGGWPRSPAHWFGAQYDIQGEAGGLPWECCRSSDRPEPCQVRSNDLERLGQSQATGLVSDELPGRILCQPCPSWVPSWQVSSLLIGSGCCYPQSGRARFRHVARRAWHAANLSPGSWATLAHNFGLGRFHYSARNTCVTRKTGARALGAPGRLAAFFTRLTETAGSLPALEQHSEDS